MTRTPKLALLLFAFVALVATPVLQAAQTRAVQPIQADRLPQALVSQPKLTPIRASLDEDSALVALAREESPRTVLTRAQFGARRIAVDEGPSLSLAATFDERMTAHRALSENFQKIPARALAEQPVVTELAIEFSDRYVLVRQVRFNVNDATVARAASPAFAEFVGPAEAQIASSAEMPADMRADFQTFIQQELPALNPDDPLRRAYDRGGEDALIAAALRGEGEFELVDVIDVPKRLSATTGSARKMHVSAAAQPKFSVIPARAPSRSPGAIVAGASRPSGPGAITAPEQYRYPAGENASGVHSFNERFIAGFTYKADMHWERTWKFGVGFFRLTAAAGFSAGLRIPFRLQGDIKPTEIARSSINAPAYPVALVLRARPFNASAQTMAAMGIPASQVLGGDEFVLSAYAKWGYKLRAFGKTWAYRALSGPSFDVSDSFTPPLNVKKEFAKVTIPTSLSRTSVNIGNLTAYVQFQTAVIGKGKIEAPVEFAYNQPSSKSSKKTITFLSDQPSIHKFTLPALSLSKPYDHVDQKFGLRIEDPSYELHSAAVGRMRSGVTLKAWKLKRTLNSPWMDLFVAPLPTVKLGPHPGTQTQYSYNKGVRHYEKRAVPMRAIKRASN